MEPTSSASTLQPFEGFISPADFTPRAGQEQLFNVAAETQADQLTAILPPGYGKTEACLGVYGILRARGIVDRCLIFVPTDQQRSQYEREARQKARRLGIDILPVTRVTKVGAQLRDHFQGKSELFIASYQQVTRSDFWFHELLAKGHWLTVLDEVHHLAVGEPWGEAIAQLPRVFTLAVTATPKRSDKRTVVSLPIKESATFHEVDPDVLVSFADAFNERACREPVGHIQHYFVDVMIGDGQVPIRINTAWLKSEGIHDEGTFNEFEAKRALRYSDKYLSKMLSDAVTRLSIKNAHHSGQHQMLVFAMSVRHAEAVARHLNGITGQKDFADWVAVSRTDAENAKVMRRYLQLDEHGDPLKELRDPLPCLVQVDKAGEGFNNPKASVLVFLHLISAETKLIQQIGRGLRRNYGIDRYEEDKCDIYVSADSPIGEYVANLDRHFGIPIEIREGGGGGGGDHILPDVHVLEVEFDREQRVLHGLNTPDEFRAKMPWLSKLTDEELTKTLEQIGILVGADPMVDVADDGRSRTMQRELWLTKIKEATSAVVGAVINARQNGSFERSYAGDLKKAINTRWIREQGVGHDDMQPEDLQRKYKWLRDIQIGIIQKAVMPEWLKL